MKATDVMIGDLFTKRQIQERVFDEVEKYLKSWQRR